MVGCIVKISSPAMRRFYTFRERKRDIIIHAGSNVGSHEVENVINSHPEVKESCVVGVPDTKYGVILVAYIEWELGCCMRIQSN